MRLIRSVIILGSAGLLSIASEVMAQSVTPNWRSTANIVLPNQTISQMRVVVRLRSRKVFVYDGEAIIASYRIAVGKSGWETPKGEYRVFSKEVNPTFKNFKTGKVIKPGPENPLGVRWIGFWTDGETQIGFHGTNEPQLIGQAVSHGCIRMLNRDVVSLFNKVSIGTPVIVQP